MRRGPAPLWQASHVADSSEIHRVLRFPFDGSVVPATLGAVVQRTVLDGTEPAREVVHAADGSWLVGDGVSDPNEPDAVNRHPHPPRRGAELVR